MPTVRTYGQNQASSQVVGTPLTQARQASTVSTGANSASGRITSSAMAPSARSIPTSGPMRQPLPTDSFGVAPINPGAVAKGMSDLAAGVSRFAQTMEEFRLRADTTEAEEALVQFEREKNKAFFDPESGYFNMQGRNAYDAAKPTTEMLGQLRDQFADKLKSPQAREMFMKAAEQQLIRAEQDVMRHASSQFEAWETATLQSRVENTLENALLFWNDPSQRAVQLELGRQTIMDIAMVKGYGAETIAENLQNYNSRFAMATIDAALNNGSASAQQALAENKELLEPQDLITVQSKIDRMLVAESDQLMSNSAVNIATTLVDQYGEYPNARQLMLDEINTIENEELRSRATRETMYQLDNRKRAESERRAEIFEAGEKFVTGGGSIDQFIAANPQAWEDLSAEQQRKLRAGTAVETDFTTWSRLLNLPRAELAKVNPADYAHKLSESDRRYLEGQVRDAITGSPEGQIGRTRAAETTSTVERLFGNSNEWNSEQRGQVDAFYAMITSEAAFRTEQKGSPLSSAEYTQLLNDMTREVIVKKPLWFDTTLSLPDVPAGEIAPITDILRNAGYDVTSDNIIRLYQQREQLRESGALPPIR